MKTYRLSHPSPRADSLLRPAFSLLIAGLLLLSSAATAQSVVFYTDRPALENAVLSNSFFGGEGVGMRTFDLNASNVGMANGVGGTPVDDQNLCAGARRKGVQCSLTWNNSATGFGADVTLAALEGGANLVWKDLAGGGFNADGISIGAIGTYLDDDFSVSWNGAPVYGFGLLWADNTPSPGEMLNVYDGSDQLIASYDLSGFGADGDGGAFIGGLSDVEIGWVMIDDEAATDDTFLRAISTVTGAIEVTTTGDWNGSGEDGECSLREALLAARDNQAVDSCRAGSDFGAGLPPRAPGFEAPDFIHVPAGTYLLDFGPLTIDSLVVVLGDGMESTVIDAQDQFSVINSVHSGDFLPGREPVRGEGPGPMGLTSTLFELSIENGYSYYGGGIYNTGSLTLVETRVANNQAEMGGGIYSSGFGDARKPSLARLYVYGSLIEDNLAKIDNEIFRGPGLKGPRAQGGGLYVESYFDMYATTVRNNRAEGGDDPFFEYQAEGGGAWIGGQFDSAYISESTFSGNVAKNRSFLNNTFARGGGLFFSSSYQGLRNTTISGNEALGELSSLGVGGGVFAEFQGDILCIGCCRLPGCRGKVVDVAAFVDFVTVTDNDASFAAGGVIGDLALANSIVIENSAPFEENCGFSTGLQSNGKNLFEAAESECPTDESDQVVTPPDTYLSDLDDHGGPVETHRLLPGSPAINAGESEDRGDYGCYEYYDGRGFSRMYSGGCDIGAYEVGENAFFDFNFKGSNVPGEQASFDIDVSNPGYYDLTVDVSSLFPAELENCSWTCEMDEWVDEYDRGGASVCSAGPISGDISDVGIVLEGGAVASYDVTCDLVSDATGSVEIPAEIDVTDGFDPVEEDNLDSFSFETSPMADIEIGVEWEAPPTGLGLWTVTVSLTNNGPSDAVDLEVREDGGLNLLLEDWDCGNGENPIRTNATLCLFDSLAAGVTETFVVTFSVTGVPGDVAESDFTVFVGTTDPDGNNNTFGISLVIAPIFESGFEKATPESLDFAAWSTVSGAPVGGGDR